METLKNLNETSTNKHNLAVTISPIIRETVKKNGLNLVSIILHGSVARGEAKSTSDIDLMLVFKEQISFDTFLARYYFQIRQDLATKGYNPDYFDILPCSEKSFNNPSKHNQSLLYHIIKEAPWVSI